MEINELKSKIDALNKRSVQVNTMRNQNIGKRETLENQCSQLFKQYEEAYGVKLTPETLEEEIKVVMSEKAKEADTIESALTALDNGDYIKANEILGVSCSEEVRQSMGIKSADASEGEAKTEAETETETAEVTPAVAEAASNATVETVSEAFKPAPAIPDDVDISEIEKAVADEPAKPVVEEPVTTGANAFNFAETFNKPASPAVAPPVAPTPAPAPAVNVPTKPKRAVAYDEDMAEFENIEPPTPIKPPKFDATPTPPVASPASDNNDMLSQFTKPSGVGGINLNVAPPAPSGSSTSPKTFESMFGGQEFHG